MRRQEGELAVETLCWPAGTATSFWSTPKKLLRIAKRRRRWYTLTYFCVGVGDGVGHGVWLEQNQLRPLTPLELLAIHAE